MKEKVESGQFMLRQDSTMAMAATEIVTGAVENFRNGEDFRRTFLERLVRRKEDIENSINSLSNGKKEYSDLFSADEIIEELDRAVLEIAAQTHFSLLERKNNELKKIKILIQRARNEEEFGLCENCERRIPEGRLLVVPEATLCVACQSEMEKWESTRGSTKKSHRASRGRRRFEWHDEDDVIENEGYVFKSGAEYVSFEDFDGTDLDYDPDEKNKK